MPTAGRKMLPLLLGVLLLAAALLALSWFVPEIREEARRLAQEKGPKSLGTLGIILAGLAAPIVYVFRALAGGLAGLLPDSSREKAIGEDNERIRRELADVRAEVERIDRERRRELEEGLRRVAALEGRIATDRQAVSALDDDIARLRAEPVPERSAAELKEMLKRGEGYVEVD